MSVKVEIFGDSTQAKAMDDVLKERFRQDEKWGVQNHDVFTWLAILHEETGEVARAALEARFGAGMDDQIREEAVQAAAVALAIVECLDRKRLRLAGLVPCSECGDGFRADRLVAGMCEPCRYNLAAGRVG